MIINKDFTYMNSQELIEKGYAELDIHSISFDRYYSEEEKQNNSLTFESMTNEEWNLHCDEIAEGIYQQMLPIITLLNEKYNIHQISEEKSTIEHYRENWDLYFYSNKGWNNKDYFDHMKLSFNGKREANENIKLLEEILLLLKNLEVKNVSCKVQYTTRINEEKVKNKSTEICKQLLDKNIEYQGMKGKIKLIDKSKEIYGFFKSRARNHYYNISDTYLVLNFGI